jgi:hypothetical protein
MYTLSVKYIIKTMGCTINDKYIYVLFFNLFINLLFSFSVFPKIIVIQVPTTLYIVDLGN